LCDLHADAADAQIGDFVVPAAIDQVPIDLHPTAAGTNDLASDDGLLATGPAAGDAKRRCAILAELCVIGVDGVVPVQPEVFLLLLRVALER
jgi:hypothetical protein